MKNLSSLWEIISDSICADTSLAEPDRKSPYDVSVTNSETRSLTQVHRELENITARLYAIVDETNNPWDFYPRLMAEVPDILSDNRIPDSIRATLDTLIRYARADIRRIYGRERRIPNEDISHVARRVIRDITQIAWVPIKDEKILESIEVNQVSASEVQEIFDLIPQLQYLNENRGVKGGLARLALKVYTYKNLPLSDHDEIAAKLLETIKAELPLSDLDIVMSEDEPDPEEFARIMGVHVLDIEEISSFREGALSDHFGRRDIASNQVVLTGGKNGTLYFTSLAQEDLSSNPGLARPIVTTIPGLYATERIVVHDRDYYSANTLYRLVKIVADQKHTYFEMPKYNLDAIQMGMYWLTIANKCSRKKNGAEIFARVYSCAIQMGATKTSNPADFLKELLQLYPTFSFRGQNLIDGVKWMVKNYIDFIKRVITRKHRIRPERESDIFTSDDDTIVRIEPNISNIEQSQIDEVKKMLAEIRLSVGEEGNDVKKVGVTDFSLDDDDIKSFINNLEKTRTERKERLHQRIEQMRKDGPQINDQVILSEGKRYPGEILFKCSEGFILNIFWGTKVLVPADLFDNPKIFSERLIAWEIKVDPRIRALSTPEYWKLCDKYDQ